MRWLPVRPRIRGQKTKQWSTMAQNNILYINPLTPQEAVGSLLQNTQQLQLHLTEIAALVSDKQNRSDFSAIEWDKLVDCLQQVLYIDHTVRRLLYSMK